MFVCAPKHFRMTKSYENTLAKSQQVIQCNTNTPKTSWLAWLVLIVCAHVRPNNINAKYVLGLEGSEEPRSRSTIIIKLSSYIYRRVDWCDRIARPFGIFHVKCLRSGICAHLCTYAVGDSSDTHARTFPGICAAGSSVCAWNTQVHIKSRACQRAAKPDARRTDERVSCAHFNGIVSHIC